MKPLSMSISGLVLVLLSTTVIGACAHIDEPKQPTTIVVPSTATTAPEYRGDGSIPTQRYVVRMSDGERDWEFEFPNVAGGYEARIPLGERDLRTAHDSLTPADRELINDMRRSDPDFERQGIYADGEHTLDQDADRNQDRADDQRTDESAPAPSRPSYLKGIDQVQRLFEAGYYEAAMNHLSDLESAYPNDTRIKSMKGTLWLRMGRERLAREAWEQVLQIDPGNEPVQEALRRLEGPADDDLDDFDDFTADDELE